MDDHKNQPKVRVLGPGEQPFLTQDSVLAWALYLAGEPFYDDLQPCVNYYTTDALRNMGLSGLKPLDAAKKASESGKKGTVEYIFQQPPPDLLKSYEDERRIIESSDELASQRIEQLLNNYRLGARSHNETVVRLAAVMSVMRAKFLTMWRDLESLVKIDSPVSKVERILPDGSRVVESSGFRFIGCHAGEETKRRVMA